MTRHVGGLVGACLLVLAALVSPAAAFDPEETFKKGTFVLSGEGSYGEQFNLEGFREWSKIAFWNVGVRGSLLPFGTSGSGVFYGAFEAGLEPLYQHYTNPHQAYWAGLAGVLRYHFLSLGRFVPYVELAGAPGGTDLRVREIDSDFSFLLWGGVGASLFLTDTTAVYAGYRYEHNSNGNIQSPNRGWESNVGVVGVSFYFP